jgi:hypothetical protein
MKKKVSYLPSNHAFTHAIISVRNRRIQMKSKELEKRLEDEITSLNESSGGPSSSAISRVE